MLKSYDILPKLSTQTSFQTHRSLSNTSARPKYRFCSKESFRYFYQFSIFSANICLGNMYVQLKTKFWSYIIYLFVTFNSVGHRVLCLMSLIKKDVSRPPLQCATMWRILMKIHISWYINMSVDDSQRP